MASSIENHFLVPDDDLDYDQETYQKPKNIDIDQESTYYPSYTTNASETINYSEYSFPTFKDGLIYRSNILDKFLQKNTSKKNKNTPQKTDTFL
mmetsp:Transcript_5853/g.826  ORF Transcript_5853/g.826 Transcript_5853/m.826 type:complete len:94 (+) Transcript_5853:23-304(+)